MAASLLLSAVLHALAAILLTLYLGLSSAPDTGETALDVEFVVLPEVRERAVRRRPLAQPQHDAPSARPSPDWRRMASAVPQVITLGPQRILTAANPTTPTPTATIPLIETAARLPDRVGGLPALQGTPNRPTPGRGVVTGLQRPQGSGGANIFESRGTADTGLRPGGRRIGSGTGTGSGPGLGLGTPFTGALRQIGENIARSSPTGKADAVFVVDASGSMVDNIRQVADNLFEISDALAANEVEYRLGVVEFRELGTGARVEMSGWTTDAEVLRQRLYAMGVHGNERALDALAQTLELMRFRADADKHLILVTDEPVTTRWDAPDAARTVQQRILSDATRAAVRVHVLGYNEAFQRQLARDTGGSFLEIPGGQATAGAVQPAPSGVILRSAELEPPFRDVAAEIARDVGAQGRADVALFLDYSRSMEGRLRAVMAGVSAFAKRLALDEVDFTIAVVRFAEVEGVTGSGVRGAVVSPPVSDVEHVQRLMQYPAAGNEYLVDGVVEGLRRLRPRSAARRYALVVTDEPSGSKSVPAATFLAEAAASGFRFYAIAPMPGGSTLTTAASAPGADVLLRVVQQSGGRAYPMPQSLSARDPAQ
jgi:Mg-chelatase subunit ChlD